MLNCCTLKDFVNLLVQYWKPIVGLLFTIVGFVIALIKKRPLNDILTDIYYASIDAVIFVENSGVVGPENKLATAINYVNEELIKKYPTLDVYRYSKLIVNIIEAILQTPHKKD